MQIVEEKPPPNATPLHWVLLTTLPITKPEDAERCLRWYQLRWRIEDWHRVLESGCRVQRLGFDTAERLRRGIAINRVIAWRIMLMTLLGREQPQLPEELLFNDVEVEVLAAFARQVGKDPPKSLGEAVLLVARLGGYLGRPSDPPPGAKIMWRGYTLLEGMAMGYELRGG